MARTTLTKTAAPGPYAADGVALTLTAADTANNNQFVASGKDIVIAQNTDGAAAHNVTITSVADDKGRTGDITNHSVPADGIAVFGPFEVAGWRQSDGKIYLEADNASIKFGIISL